MPELSVTLCGHTTTIACADDDEARLRHLVRVIAQRTDAARAIVGDNDRWRQMLFAAIFLADELEAGDPVAGSADTDNALPPVSSREERTPPSFSSVGSAQAPAAAFDPQRLDAALARINATIARLEKLVDMP